MSYRDDLKIDLSSLEFNLQEQADLVGKYGEEWSHKLKERDRAKENIAVVDSEQDTFIRKNWDDLEEAKGMKLTEKSVLSLVLKSKEHKEAFNNLLDIQEEVNILSIAKSAFDHRKRALSDLVTLYVSGYWADPKVAASDMKMVREDECRNATSKELEKSLRVKKLKKKPILKKKERN